jgi:hypothetical protein
MTDKALDAKVEGAEKTDQTGRAGEGRQSGCGL